MAFATKVGQVRTDLRAYDAPGSSDRVTVNATRARAVDMSAKLTGRVQRACGSLQGAYDVAPKELGVVPKRVGDGRVVLVFSKTSVAAI